MNIIQKYLTEHYPNNPGEIVLKNSFYPSGLKEIDIYNYYMKVKKPLLKWLKGRRVAFFLLIDDKIIVKRKTKDKPYIILTAGNFENVITGRTLEVLVQHPNTTNYFIVDVDPGRGFKRQDALKAANFVQKNTKKILEVKSFETISTSSIGIHVIGYLSKNYNINKLRTKLYNVLKESLDQTKDKTLILNVKGRDPRFVNLDLSSMYENSLHICKYSLTKDGLICTDVKKGLLKIK